MTTFARIITPHDQPFATTLWRNRAMPLATTLLAGCVFCASAQETTPGPSSPASAAKSTPLPKHLQTLIAPSNPAWQDLSPEQRVSLQPLAEQWNTLDEARKRKWLAIAVNYKTLAPPEQAKMHSRMSEWLSLSKQERNQARLTFSQSKQLTPTQKTATWDAYQSLSTEEKKKLATQAPSRPTGAATTIKQTPPEKLSLVPNKHKLPSETPKTVTATPSYVNRHTLLPHAQHPVAPASKPNN